MSYLKKKIYQLFSEVGSGVGYFQHNFSLELVRVRMAESSVTSTENSLEKCFHKKIGSEGGCRSLAIRGQPQQVDGPVFYP
jgi:hypothetical protein